MKQWVSLSAIFFVLVASGCSAHRAVRSGGQVRMTIRVAGARTVQFASSLDQHHLHPVTRTPSGAWTVTLPAGREFRYYYVVDGKPYLPDCTLREEDDFGSENCIYVPAP